MHLRQYAITTCILFIVFYFWSCSKTDDAPGSAAVSVVPDVLYGKAPDYVGDTLQLTMDLYIGAGATRFQPLVVLLHDGDFQLEDKADLQGICNKLAAKGLTVVSVNYRLGWRQGGTTCGGNAYSLLQAAYRATQDLHAALRFLVAKSRNYRIDTGTVFVGGFGSGAVAALAATFCSQSEFSRVHPSLEPDLGGVQQGGNDLRNTYAIKGVINIGGGMLLPDMIGTGERTPVIGFHAAADPVVPYDRGFFASCPNYPKLCGSRFVYQSLRSKDISAILHTAGGDGSVLFDDDYISQNSYCFIKSVLNGTALQGSFTNTVSLCP